MRKETFRMVHDRRAHRRGGHRPPLGLRRLGRLGDLRVHRRQARHPPRQAVPGDDQLADLRPATRPQRVLEGDRRFDDAARHQPRRRSLRRASYYINASRRPPTRAMPWPRCSASCAMSACRSASSTPGSPTSPTPSGCTVADQKNKVYYFENTTSPEHAVGQARPTRLQGRLGPAQAQLDGNPDLGGDQTANFKPAEPFKFLAPKD